METEFNRGRSSKSGYGERVMRRGAPKASSQTDPLPSATGLESELKSSLLVRPDKVHKAKALVAGGKYPPDKVLERIAGLLAIHLKQ